MIKLIIVCYEKGQQIQILQSLVRGVSDLFIHIINVICVLVLFILVISHRDIPPSLPTPDNSLQNLPFRPPPPRPPTPKRTPPIPSPHRNGPLLTPLSFLDRQRVEPWKLYVMVGSFVVVDVIVLGVWQGVDPQQRTLEVFPLEVPRDTVEDIKIKPELEHCESHHNTIWLGEEGACVLFLFFSFFGLFFSYFFHFTDLFIHFFIYSSYIDRCRRNIS